MIQRWPLAISIHRAIVAIGAKAEQDAKIAAKERDDWRAIEILGP